jgi:hypothetical protein
MKRKTNCPTKPETPRAGRPGIPCPTCGSCESSVDRTLVKPGHIARVRRCKACRRTWPTREQTGTYAPDPATYAETLIRTLESDPLFHLKRGTIDRGGQPT